MDTGNVNLFGELEPPVSTAAERANLAARFGVPPFSILDARQGYWQDRKRAWLALGIKSEIGRSGNSVPNGGDRPPEQDGCWTRTGRKGALDVSPQALEASGGREAYSAEAIAVRAAAAPGRYRVSKITEAGREDMTPFQIQ